MSFSGLGFWTGNPVLYASLGVFVIGFFVWILIGFPILEGTLGVVLNSITKVTTFSITTAAYVKDR